LLFLLTADETLRLVQEVTMFARCALKTVQGAWPRSRCSRIWPQAAGFHVSGCQLQPSKQTKLWVTHPLRWPGCHNYVAGIPRVIATESWEIYPRSYDSLVVASGRD